MLNRYKGKNDGHISVFKFTTNFKAVEGTPSGLGYDMRSLYDFIPGFPTMKEAVKWAKENSEALFWFEDQFKDSLEKCAGVK